MALPPKRPEQLVGTVFRSRDVRANGLLTRRQLEGDAWRRLFRGVYADAELPVDHALRCRAARLLLPPGAAIARLSAACEHGVRLVADGDPVEVVVPRGRRFGPVAGLRISSADLAGGDVQEHRTTPARTAFDLAMGRDVIEAVMALDALAAGGVLRPLHLAGLRDRLSATPGGRRGLRALDLHDPAAESPQESRLRVRLVLAGLPRPRSQYVVRDARRDFVARVDFAWPDARVALEYDGVWHADAAQLWRDRRRLNRLVAAGWTVLHVTADRLRHEFDLVVAELAACLTPPPRCG